MIVQHIR